ncbi:PIG-L deacetylase family protein [Salinicoccus halitifaciens]|uniref:LmbE family N-acetylglucosaminyl deacetylase n=1 Tax=Salinicoccus halitifaciens TaxID=1073415 RepID=A0ABV2E7V4_9STAP|nr:PIG-L deacetylase family protein [Salinicoccus halitifaciens]MCD2136463.1 PIG-L family deacetylase [Salinicoccus halitifaciens]
MKVLVFAPHNDDEVLGVGGTIAKYVKAGHSVYVCEVTSTPDPEWTKEEQTQAKAAHEFLGVEETIFLNLPMIGLRHYDTAEFNGKVHDVVQQVQPEVVFLPHKGDMNFDHAEVTYSAMVALRPFNVPNLKEVLAYETLSETEWNTPTVDNVFMPNVFIDITDTIEDKLKAMEFYKGELKAFPHPRSLEAMRALSVYRGSTINVNHAEAFMLLRSVRKQIMK